MTSNRYGCNTIGRVDQFPKLRWRRDFRRLSKEKIEKTPQQQQNKKRLH